MENKVYLLEANTMEEYEYGHYTEAISLNKATIEAKKVELDRLREEKILKAQKISEKYNGDFEKMTDDEYQIWSDVQFSTNLYSYTVIEKDLI